MNIFEVQSCRHVPKEDGCTCSNMHCACGLRGTDETIRSLPATKAKRRVIQTFMLQDSPVFPVGGSESAAMSTCFLSQKPCTKQKRSILRKKKRGRFIVARSA